MKKVRLDTLLVERGYFADKDQALRAVLAHKVKVDDVYAQSAALLISPDAQIEVKSQKKYVSRGGVKLQAALEAFDFDPTGLNCIDVGCSTGGFTDCLLQAGAAHVTCVDVDYGNLAWKLRQDERVTVFEKTNIRIADPVKLGAPFDLVVTDLSFIGLAQLAPVFSQLCAKGSSFIGLIKPQFESAHHETQRGVVTDEGVRARTIDEVRTALENSGFACQGIIESPIKGKRLGNIEYLIKAVKLD